MHCRKNPLANEPAREEFQAHLNRAKDNPSLVQFYISKQWLNKFESFAEPGTPREHTHYIYASRTLYVLLTQLLRTPYINKH